MKRGAARDDIPEVTAKQIEVFGRRFLGRRVKMSNCIFAFTGNECNLEYLENGLSYYPQDIPESGEDGWISFAFRDAKLNWVNNAYASMEHLGESIVNIDFDARIHVEGVVARLYDDIHKGELEFYGLVVDKLVVIGDLDELEW